MPPKPIKDTKSTVPQVDDSAEPGPSSSSNTTAEIPVHEEADDDIIFLTEVKKSKTSAAKENVKEEDESDGEDSDESEEVDSDGDTDDQGESDDSENIESDEEEEREESDDQSENKENETDDENESDDSSIEILENDENPEDDGEEEVDLEEDLKDDGEEEVDSEDDSDDGENEEEQEEEGGDSRVARSRRVPPASNDQVPSTSRKRMRSPSIEIVYEESTSRKSQATSKKPKKSRHEVQEENQENATGEEGAEENPDDSNDDEADDQIDQSHIKNFLTQSVEQNADAFANIRNFTDFMDYTLAYFYQNPVIYQTITQNLQGLTNWFNQEFVIGAKNWSEFMNNPEVFEDLHRNCFEHYVEENGIIISLPLEQFPVLFPGHILQRRQEKMEEYHERLRAFYEAKELIRRREIRENEKRRAEMKEMTQRNAEFLEKLRKSRR